MIRVFSGSAATSCASRLCASELYSTIGGQALIGVSKPAIPQPLKQIIAITRAPGRGLQHLPLNIMMSLQMLQPRGRAPSALARTAKVEDKQRDGEGGKRHPRCPTRPRPGEKPGQNGAPHHRVPLRQSSTLAQTATVIPASASAINTQRRVSR